MDGVSQIWLRISNTLRAIVTHYRLVFFCLVIGLLRLIVFAFMCRFHFWDIWPFQKHTSVVDGNTVAHPNINDNTLKFIWLKGDLSSFFFRLQNDAWHVDVKSFFVKVTGNFDLSLLRLLVGVVRVSTLVDVVAVGFINSVLDRYENTFDSIVCNVSVYNQPQFFLVIFHRFLRQSVIAKAFGAIRLAIYQLIASFLHRV